MDSRPNNLSLLTRRHALAGLAALPAATLAAPAVAQDAARRPTPRQSLGPFYPRDARERPRQTDADLLAVDGDKVLSRGVPLYLSGRVLDRQGRPVADALVEIWQCDANAVYHHPAGGAVSERDPNFQGYGRAQTDGEGGFHFRTIRPVPYPGRTPHIHARVEARGFSPLATQLYLADDPGNARDFLFRQLSADERAQLLLTPRRTESSHPLARATQFSASAELVLA
ncbi:MAG: protocatechuate 3,4-dioxygenase [Burkholderiaceae bacterium]|jgi:protocatechuate 3,4-dioxygenase beta subunit|nr:protocatechuate 3,4-dioxygenase [Burkholderiaceae bacterium]